jgi:hypothetical protein
MRSSFLICLLLVMFAGCNGAGTSQGISEGGQQGNGDTDDSTACTETVVDTGAKSATTTSRGIVSVVKIDPIGSKEAFAYYDTTALAVKFSYWDGTKYVHELVAGYGTAANNISLVFLSTGIPVIAWTSNGTDVMLSIRGANISTASSSWTSKVFSAVATQARTVKLEVTPTNMVGGVFYTHNTTAGRLKMLLCTSNCHLVGNYSAMGASDYVGNDNNNPVATQVSVGFAWCGADTNTDGTVDAYYPSAVYTRGAATARYTVCPNATTSACLTSAGWTQNAQYATTANVSATLHIDPTVSNDPPKILALRAGTGVKAYIAGTGAAPVTCKDVVSATTFDESTQTLGGTTSGNLWLTLMKSNDGKFHAVMNDTTSSVRYYNTSSGTLSSWDTFWNTAAGILNTTTVSGQGSSVYDSTTDSIISSYYGNAAIYRLNFLVNKITSIPTLPASVISTNGFVNTDGHMSLSASNTRNVRVAKTSSGEAGVAYVDFSFGTTTTGVLKYAYRDGRLISSSWRVNIIPGVTAPSSPYLAYDHLDRPWISYFDATNFRFYLVTNSSTDGTGAWSSFVFPLTPTGIYVLPATNDTSIAMVQSGTSKIPVMTVLDNTNTGAGRSVRSARFDMTTASWSSPVSIYVPGATGTSGLTTFADELGNMSVAFLDRTAGANNFLKYSQSEDGGVTFSTPLNIGTVALGGQGTSVMINPIDGSPFVIYHDRANNRLYRAACSSSFADCDTGGWSVDILDIFTGVSALTIVATGNENLLSSSVAMRDDGAYDVLYSHGMAATGDLRRIKVASDGTASAGATWVSGVGINLATTLNHGVQGFNSDSVITPDNQLVSLYTGRGNVLVQKTCDLDIQD